MLYVWKKKSGIFLDGGNFNYEHNVRLIQLMQQFKRKNNCRLYWKFHPTTNPVDYEPHIRYEQDVCSKDILLKDFLEKIDAGIVSNSTVMMERIKSWIPAFIYVDDKQEYDMYTKFDDCKKFMIKYLTHAKICYMIGTSKKDEVSICYA